MMPPFCLHMQLEEKILSLINAGKCAFSDLPGIMHAAHIPSRERKETKKILDGLCARGVLLRERAFYGTPEQWGAFKGTVRANARGFAFISPEKGGDDYFVAKKNQNGALDMDVVLAYPVRAGGDEAKIVKILSRGRNTVVGRFAMGKDAGYVLPDRQNYLSDVYIPLSLCGGAKDGDKVVAEITSYPHNKLVGGKIKEILGRDGDFEAEEMGIIKSFELSLKFPEEVIKEAEKQAAQRIDFAGRRDLTSLLTITIDGDDTRDIDDAVSLEKTDGGYILGVHIADVAQYVLCGSATDKEAYSRGTSVYFPDRVLPMLPPALSNGACSLNEGETRYALSCLMTVDDGGKILKSEICESVIKSDKRLTYTRVDGILNGGNHSGVSAEICAMLHDMARLTAAFEAVREELGGITLDIKEAHIYLDERGEIVIPEAKRTLSQRLIEQFMVAANECVAKFLGSAGAPCLYRIHEPPAPEKAEAFDVFLRGLGITAKRSQEPTPRDYREILNRAADKPYCGVISEVMLRTMQKARYSEENRGHFGLASPCYCHFTSPIRRYPDMFVHRAVKSLLRKDKAGLEELAEIAGEAAAHSSGTEKRADGAERAVDDLYKTVYMSDRLGEKYRAIISGVTAYAVYAELPNAVEGMIRLESLPRDSYEFYADKYLLKGKRRSYRIGDGITVKVAGCDFSAMKVLFAICDD